MKNNITEIKVALIGNPNVGKSSIFNALTGMHQHTGNWAGKTVDNAIGYFKSKKFNYKLIDLPGTYSIDSDLAEEKIACENLNASECDIVAVVCDATSLQRSLILAQRVVDRYDRVLIILNLIDEAKKRGIIINEELLSKELNALVISVCAKDRKCKQILSETLDTISVNSPVINHTDSFNEKSTQEYILNAKKIYDTTVINTEEYSKRDLIIDKVITSKIVAFPIIILFMTLIFWLTIAGANYPSELLAKGFSYLEIKLKDILIYIKTPTFIVGVVIDGIYRVLSWVVSVMLPPMAIFFPLFTLLEDVGFLPRIAYNLDRPFRFCGTCGKQSLTMCMGIGCNAVGVCGARIIGSEKDRVISIITNSFMPCNGRFPAIIAIISIFFIAQSQTFISGLLCAMILSSFLILSIITTMLTTFVLSKILMKGKSRIYSLELPPYRFPQITKTIIRSIIDKTAIVLFRAVRIAAPAGLIIYILSNLKIGESTLITILSELLSPIGLFLGLDGAILLAFILGMPANEIVLPILLMIYMSQGKLLEFSDISELKNILVDNGWSLLTAVNFITFSIFHFPCSTTLISIYKETKSKKLTLISFILPCIIGLSICLINKVLFSLFT